MSTCATETTSSTVHITVGWRPPASRRMTTPWLPTSGCGEDHSLDQSSTPTIRTMTVRLVVLVLRDRGNHLRFAIAFPVRQPYNSYKRHHLPEGSTQCLLLLSESSGGWTTPTSSSSSRSLRGSE